MNVLDLAQGSDAWLLHRSQHFGGSDAPVIMGASRHTKRSDFLRMLYTGDKKEYSAWVQEKLLDAGHAIEAKVRPIVEEMIGEKLTPLVCTSSKFSASLDGITADHKIILEVKSWNEDLAHAVRANNLSPEYYWQLEHQLGVTKAERVFFVVSDGTKAKFEFLVYLPVEGRRKQLEQAWGQFAQDLTTYKPTESKPEAVGKEIAALPALAIQLSGEVKASNLVAYKGAALAFIQTINTSLKTDNDFADAEKAVKFCEKAEKELELVKKQALGQTATIDDLFRAVDELKEAMRQKRLELDKLIKARKETIRVEIRQEGEQALRDHKMTLDKRLGLSMPEVPALFADVMRGKKTVSSLQDAVAVEVSRVKIAMNDTAERISANLKIIDAEEAFLFSDRNSLACKEPELVRLTVENRLREHKLAEEKRLAETRNQLKEEVKAEVKAELHKEQTVLPEILTTAEVAAQRNAAQAQPSFDEVIPDLRPSNQQIIYAVADTFKVPFITALDWLKTMEHM